MEHPDMAGRYLENTAALKQAKANIRTVVRVNSFMRELERSAKAMKKSSHQELLLFVVKRMRDALEG